MEKQPQNLLKQVEIKLYYQDGSGITSTSPMLTKVLIGPSPIAASSGQMNVIKVYANKTAIDDVLAALASLGAELTLLKEKDGEIVSPEGAHGPG